MNTRPSSSCEAQPQSQALVYLVGAGPGDPGLLTIKAREVLGEASVVIYDYLASDAVMRFANPQAEHIFVGKKGYSQHVTQDEINEVLINAARDNSGVIVRLKGGDPFVFGRGGEEALALRKAGIRFCVIPGITAGVAAPAYAGIPVTHRGVACSVTLITGHETPDKDAPTINWEYLAKGTDTLCFYMGIRDLPTIAQRLIEGGRSKDTPVALIRWGTTAAQEELTSTLEHVVEDVERVHFKAPAIIVVGEVAALAGDLSWFDPGVLAGKTVVVTRSREQASVLSRKLGDEGAQVVEFPTIEISPRTPSEESSRVLRALASGNAYDWVIFTSVNGVACTFDLLRHEGLDARAFGGVHIAAIGPKTTEALAEHGLVADVVPERFVAESVFEALSQQGVGADTRVLIARAAEARDVLIDLLRKAHAQVEVLPVYDTVMPHAGDAALDLAEKLREGAIDAVTFTSSSTVKNFMSLLQDVCDTEELVHLLEPVLCASIGPITSDTMRSMGISVDIEADIYTIDGLVSALLEGVEAREKP